MQSLLWAILRLFKYLFKIVASDSLQAPSHTFRKPNPHLPGSKEENKV